MAATLTASAQARGHHGRVREAVSGLSRPGQLQQPLSGRGGAREAVGSSEADEQLYGLGISDDYEQLKLMVEQVEAGDEVELHSSRWWQHRRSSHQQQDSLASLSSFDSTTSSQFDGLVAAFPAPPSTFDTPATTPFSLSTAPSPASPPILRIPSLDFPPPLALSLDSRTLRAPSSTGSPPLLTPPLSLSRSLSSQSSTGSLTPRRMRSSDSLETATTAATEGGPRTPRGGSPAVVAVRDEEEVVQVVEVDFDPRKPPSLPLPPLPLAGPPSLLPTRPSLHVASSAATLRPSLPPLLAGSRPAAPARSSTYPTPPDSSASLLFSLSSFPSAAPSPQDESYRLPYPPSAGPPRLSRRPSHLALAPPLAPPPALPLPPTPSPPPPSAALEDVLDPSSFPSFPTPRSARAGEAQEKEEEPTTFSTHFPPSRSPSPPSPATQQQQQQQEQNYHLRTDSASSTFSTLSRSSAESLKVENITAALERLADRPRVRVGQENGEEEGEGEEGKEGMSASSSATLVDPSPSPGLAVKVDPASPLKPMVVALDAESLSHRRLLRRVTSAVEFVRERRKTSLATPGWDKGREEEARWSVFSGQSGVSGYSREEGWTSGGYKPSPYPSHRQRTTTSSSASISSLSSVASSASASSGSGSRSGESSASEELFDLAFDSPDPGRTAGAGGVSSASSPELGRVGKTPTTRQRERWSWVEKGLAQAAVTRRKSSLALGTAIVQSPVEEEPPSPKREKEVRAIEDENEEEVLASPPRPPPQARRIAEAAFSRAVEATRLREASFNSVAKEEEKEEEELAHVDAAFVASLRLPRARPSRALAEKALPPPPPPSSSEAPSPPSSLPTPTASRALHSARSTPQLRSPANASPSLPPNVAPSPLLPAATLASSANPSRLRKPASSAPPASIPVSLSLTPATPPRLKPLVTAARRTILPPSSASVPGLPPSSGPALVRKSSSGALTGASPRPSLLRRPSAPALSSSSSAASSTTASPSSSSPVPPLPSLLPRSPYTRPKKPSVGSSSSAPTLPAPTPSRASSVKRPSPAAAATGQAHGRRPSLATLQYNLPSSSSSPSTAAPALPMSNAAPGSAALGARGGGRGGRAMVLPGLVAQREKEKDREQAQEKPASSEMNGRKMSAPPLGGGTGTGLPVRVGIAGGRGRGRG
ncbi:hypothetical protein JCM8097_006470 [Rhodosporidiobolus ruineniae]